MKFQSQRGIALVITLIMLSVVTVMAVVFLGISRRERFSVGVTEIQTQARLAAETGSARAVSEVLARIAATDNMLDYEYFVSTNYISPRGFLSGVSSITNVSYVYANREPITGGDLRQNLTNLFLDPRPPVFVRTNQAGPLDFRFYLDLNRNGAFETNPGVVWENGRPVGTNYFWGDPEWVGVLSRPEWPHSGDNRFESRYAYLVLPAGKSLDINHIHNHSKGLTTQQGSGEYNRHQGVGSYELNLAAFLRTWLPTPGFYTSAQYGFQAEGPNAHAGLAFAHARQVVNNRQIDGPRSMFQMWGNRSTRLQFDPVDYYADDYYPVNGAAPAFTNDNPNLPWPGNDNYRAYRTVSDLISTDGPVPSPLAVPLLNAGRDLVTTTNRYAFYRLLSQMGTDSVPVSRGKINLNFVNGYWSSPDLVGGVWTRGQTVLGQGRPAIVGGMETNLVAWSTNRQARQDFFMLTADAILKEIFSDLLPRGLEQGIPVYPTNYYSGAVHRCLQMAANILDANALTPPTTGRILSFGTGTNLIAPTVFRPIFAWEDTNKRQLKIVGYEEVEDAVPLSLPWRDLTQTNQLNQTVSGDNILGIPWVIAAQKGWPTFNELTCETLVSVTRRLQAMRPTPVSRSISFRQNYQIAVSNQFGVEAWNAYTQEFGGRITVQFTNLVTMGLVDSNRTDAPYGRVGLVEYLRPPYNLVQTNFTLDVWPAREFRVATNVVDFIPRSNYLPGQSAGPLLATNVYGVIYDTAPGFSIPNWRLEITNRLFYAATVEIDGRRRVIDLVTLNPLVAGFDIQRFMAGDTNLFADNRALEEGSFWLTNRQVNSVMAMTAGITNQIFVSTNENEFANWANWSEDPVSGQQKQRAIDEFRMFMGMPPYYDLRRTNTAALVVQVPFTPSRQLLQHMSWQANDPLVHYTFDDLYSSEYANPTNVIPVLPNLPLSGYTPGMPNLGIVNARYSPWGGRPNRELSGQAFAYNPAVQDPGVTQADDWEFPTNALPSIGWLGRIHRGTAWQTFYLKSGVETRERWIDYAGETPWNFYSHPTNDWRLLDLFTTALSENMTRGLLGVNQTNEAAWAAVFAGLRVRTNTITSLNPADSATYSATYVQPSSAVTPQIYRLVEGINTNRFTRLGGRYRYMGEILSAPVMTDNSPFLNLAGLASGQARINDAVYEGLPQSVLGLLKSDDPYFVIYSYGQALVPADRSLVLTPGDYYNLCTNYQIAGEVLTKTAVRIEREVDTTGTNVFYNAVVEDFSILPVD